MCSTHWARWRTHGDPYWVTPSSDVQQKSPCGVADCERFAHAHGYCTSHLYRLQRYGDPLADGVGMGVRPPIARPTYDGAHRRIQYRRGRAAEYVCADCGADAREWSYDGGDPDEMFTVDGVAYSGDPARYSPRCIPCHRRRGRVRRGVGESAAWCRRVRPTGCADHRAGRDIVTRRPRPRDWRITRCTCGAWVYVTAARCLWCGVERGTDVGSAASSYRQGRLGTRPGSEPPTPQPGGQS